MTETGLTTAQLRRLRASFSGEVITPADDTYDEARRLWNAVNDRRPAVVARPTTDREVAAVIRFAREHDLEIGVRSGGHCHPGVVGQDGGLVVDLSRRRGVSVDPSRRVARANGGALLGEVDVASQAHGLVCPTGVVGHTGVAGLTLGGGVGRLQRHFGLTVDNLRAVELVTADGRSVRASATEEPDLFWGMRGAGWNFGIATAFEFDLHPFGPDLHRGVRIYPATAAHEVWDVFQDYAASAPDTVAMIYSIAPPDDGTGDPIVVVSYNHSGSPDTMEHDTAGLRRGPEPMSVSGGSHLYLDVQTAHDLVLGWGGRSFIKGLYADVLRPDAIDALVDHVAAGPAGGSFSVTAMGGAIARVEEGSMAFAGRQARFDMSPDASWTDPADDAPNTAWVRQAMAFVEADAIEGRYANENSDAGPDETLLIYGATKVARLATLKRTWDPDNVFHANHNVAPAPD